MNKFFRIAAVVATTFAFFSCNNGAYDAQPDKNEGKNYLNPNSGVTVPLGTIKIVVEGISYLFRDAGYIDTMVDGRKQGWYAGVPYQHQFPNTPFIAIAFQHAENQMPDATVKTYGTVIYSFIHPKLKTRVFYSSFDYTGAVDTSNWQQPANAQIKGIDEGKNIYGTLAAGKYHIMPMEVDSSGKFIKPPVGKDTLINISGEFHMPMFTTSGFPYRHE